VRNRGRQLQSHRQYSQLFIGDSEKTSDLELSSREPFSTLIPILHYSTTP